MVERVREVVIERHGDLKLKVGGKHGYVRVRGGQGSTKDQYHVPPHAKRRKYRLAGPDDRPASKLYRVSCS